MEEDPFPTGALRPVTLADRAIFDRYFSSLSQPLSDYTFAQFYTWRNSLRILWTLLHNHLCVFANGTGDLTLLAPPIGDTHSDTALAQAFDLMDTYNARKGVPQNSRVEYTSDELLSRFNQSNLSISPLGTDYIYNTRSMIDLAGGDLASKRQAKNRFLRNYPHRVEPYDRVKHLGQCLLLLSEWKTHQDDKAPDSTASIKRTKESAAAELTLDAAEQLGLKGMVVYVNDRVRAFTFGEPLTPTQSSITIEKTDLQVKGLAQFIFSEFCRTEWADRPLVNVGDDWGVPSLAWTKMSYRPIQLLQKYVLRQAVKVQAQIPAGPELTTIRPAHRTDLEAAVRLEQTCFSIHSLKKRQLQYLQGRPNTIFLIAEHAGQVIGDGIALIRRHKTGLTGRIYSLAVGHESRGKGIGKKLLGQMLDSLAGRGVMRVYLEVDDANKAAIRLYERSGFRRLGVLPDYYGEGKNGLHMVKELIAEMAEVRRT